MTTSDLTVVQDSAVILDQSNIDTDQIIPKQFLTGITRSGYGKHLFHDWRFLDDAGHTPNPEFILNQPEHKDAGILITRKNFGCGSSREHAPWALKDFGFKAIIAESFADIFYGNCINNQLLPITLNQTSMDKLLLVLNESPSATVSIDLTKKQVAVNTSIFHFSMSDQHLERLMKGLDEIGLTLKSAERISAFEADHFNWIKKA